MRTIRERRYADRDAAVEALRVVHEADHYPGRWPRDPGSWLYRDDVLAAWVSEGPAGLSGHVVLRAAGGQVPVRLWSAASGLDPGRCALVARLFVVPAVRGTGLGRRLLDTACAEAARRDLHPVLDVADENREAVRLYERLSWVPLGSYEQEFVDGGPPELLHCYAAPVSAAR